MTIDLTTARAIETALVCSMVIPGYGTLRFTDYNKTLNVTNPITNQVESFTGLGGLLSVSETTSDLKATTADVTIAISGIPQQNMTDFLTHKIKGSKVYISRVAFAPGGYTSNPDTVIGKFYGYINNYAIDETWDGLDSTVTITVMCKSTIGLLMYKKAGRRTNPIDQKQFYPNDVSMDRVPSLAGSKIHFGAI
jgi:hypothetical protein